MKKFILSLGLIAAAFSLTNCSQNDDFTTTEPTPSTPFELFASVTRTTNDGLNTLWKNGDELTVFHAENGTETFVNNGKFTLADASTGRFSGTLAGKLTAESYDWYVTYPYYSGFTKPGTGKANNIGCTKDTRKQTQNGNNSSAHISGKYLPLIGVAKGVAAGETPAITLRNAASFAKFTITNKLSEPITITSVEMTAEGYYLVGEFYIKFAKDPVTYDKTASNTFSTALLEVTNGEAIAAGESATFYMAVAPFTLTESSTISFKVTATNSDEMQLECAKNATCNAGWGFTAGRYKEISFGFEALDATVAATTAEATDTESVEGTTATLNGSYAITNASGNESVTCGFEYKLSSASDYTSVTAESAATFTYTLTGLTAGSEYTYRAWASLDGGTTKAYGEEKTFATTVLDVSVKSFTLTSDDININQSWSYATDHSYTYVASDGSEWVATGSTRSQNQNNIQIKYKGVYGYLASPIVSGNITKIEANIKKGTGAALDIFANSTDGDAIVTHYALGDNAAEYTFKVETSGVKQVFFRAYTSTGNAGVIYINSVTIYYTE